MGSADASRRLEFCLFSDRLESCTFPNQWERRLWGRSAVSSTGPVHSRSCRALTWHPSMSGPWWSRRLSTISRRTERTTRVRRERRVWRGPSRSGRVRGPARVPGGARAGGDNVLGRAAWPVLTSARHRTGVPSYLLTQCPRSEPPPPLAEKHGRFSPAYRTKSRASLAHTP